MKPWVKTSLAPGLAGGHRLPRPRRAHALPRQARVRARRLRVHDLHRELGPAASTRSRPPSTRATSTSWRCSRATGTSRAGCTRRCAPPTWRRRRSCVAYALAGRIDLDLTTDPLGEGADGPGVPARPLAERRRGARRGGDARSPRSSSPPSTRASGTATSTGAALADPDRSGLRVGARRRPTCRSRRSSRISATSARSATSRARGCW